jgi:hypothetical protein
LGQRRLERLNEQLPILNSARIRNQLRILWLKTELLHPVDKGGKIRTYHMLKALRREHHVTYLTLDDGSAAVDAPALAAEYAHELVRVPHRVRAKFSAGRRIWRLLCHTL